MPRIKICHEILQKDVYVAEGDIASIIEDEVLKRLVTVTGIAKLSCTAAPAFHRGDHTVYTVDVHAPTGVVLFSLFVRWYGDNEQSLA